MTYFKKKLKYESYDKSRLEEDTKWQSIKNKQAMFCSGGTTLVLGATGVSILQPLVEQDRKEETVKETVVAKQAEVEKLQTEINVGDSIGTTFVDTKDFFNQQGELVTGKYVTFNKADQIKQLKSQIKDTRAENIKLSFGENALTYAIPTIPSLWAAIFVYKGIRLIRKKFGENIDNFCDGMGNKVQKLLKPKAPKEI